MTRKCLAGPGGGHHSSRAVVADRGFGAVASRRTLRWASGGGDLAAYRALVTCENAYP